MEIIYCERHSIKSRSKLVLRNYGAEKVIIIVVKFQP